MRSKRSRVNRIRRMLYITPEAYEVYCWFAEQLRVFPGHLMSETLETVAEYMGEVKKDIERLEAGADEGFLVRSILRRSFLALSELLYDSDSGKGRADRTQG